MKVRFCLYALLCVCVSIFPSPESVLADSNTVLLKQQRKYFRLAIKAIQTNQFQQFLTYKKQLHDYPLQPYLDYLYLRHKLGQLSPDKIARFLNKNQHTFYAKRLRNHWLDHLAQKKQWDLFLKHYREPQTASRQCLRLQALIATKQDEQVFKDILPLWLTSRSQDKACDPVFNYWQEKKLLTDDLRWQRMILALYDNQFSLAHYLAQSLTNPLPARHLVTNWKQAHFAPRKFLIKHSATPQSFHSREMIQHALMRLAYQDPEQAYYYWQQLKFQSLFREENRLMIQRTIANQAALNHDKEALLYFTDLPNTPWRVRAALWQQNWKACYQAIRDLNSNLAEKTVWRYWLAKSQEQLGNQQQAKSIYHTLASERDFYGFLAADKLHLPYQMNHHPIQYDKQEIEKLRKRPEVKRLKEFFAMGLLLEARRQAYELKQKLSGRELQLLANLTHHWGWYHQTIALLGKAKYWDALDLRFPVVFDDSIIRESKKNGLDPSWIFGIARQESAFNTQAHSQAGALGMMQLMPETGKLIARLINKPLKRRSELFIPERNIQLGSAYLRRLYNQFQRNPVLATAAYNAGPNRVTQWLPEQWTPADIWIENIPYRETRHYVKSVLSYATIFDYQRKKTIQPLSKRMPAIHPEKQ